MLRIFYAFAFFLAVANAAAQEGAVGQITFVSGEVQLQAGAESRPPQVGDTLYQGQELITKATGYAYIKTSDNGFISLRPNTAVRFEVYQYSPAQPSDSRIKISLKYGVMRSVSGAGAQSARDKYRLNTPVAAIGLRGTDFTVFATADLTRAAVTSGGIVMSGFNDRCTPNGSGPCQGDQAAELLAKQADALLQIRRGEARPAMLGREFLYLQPDRAVPPLQNENSGKNPLPGQSDAPDIGSSQAIAVKQGAALHDALEQVSAPPPAPQIFWGRWQILAGMPDAGAGLQELLSQKGNRLVALNPLFGLVGEQQTNLVLPSAGVYNFSLQSHESYILSEASPQALPARIENPALSVDFNQKRFDTRFTVRTDQHNVNVAAYGSVLSDGTMVSELIGPTATVRGALANDAKQAGFLYQQRINPGQIAVGATYWAR